MSERRLELAEALLAKARCTGFTEERDSFVSGAYSQLGSFLDSAPDAASTKREEGGAEEPLALGAAATDPEDVPAIIDLSAMEAYNAAAAHPARRGALVDLVI
ncbi:MAG: hypothetical protein ACRDRL_16545 [Sciscionella sp.]